MGDDCCDTCRRFAGPVVEDVPVATASLRAAPAELVVVVRTRGGERRLPVTGERMRIGRGKDCEIVIDDSMLSRKQAELRFVDGAVRIVDLGSSCGTYVDGHRVDDGELADGAVINFGGSSVRVVKP